MTNQNQPLGNERFYETIERMAGPFGFGNARAAAIHASMTACAALVLPSSIGPAYPHLFDDYTS